MIGGPSHGDPGPPRDSTGGCRHGCKAPQVILGNRQSLCPGPTGGRPAEIRTRIGFTNVHFSRSSHWQHSVSARKPISNRRAIFYHGATWPRKRPDSLASGIIKVPDLEILFRYSSRAVAAAPQGARRSTAHLPGARTAPGKAIPGRRAIRTCRRWPTGRRRGTSQRLPSATTAGTGA